MQGKPVIQRVIDCLEQTTRYPRALLTEGANLADDLGIDSVKQVEIVLALESAFGVKLDRAQVATVHTIAEVAQFVSRALAATPEAVDRRPPAPAPVVAPLRPVDRLPPREVAPAPAPRPSPTSRALEGRVILVTGSGQGLGRSVVQHLARQGAKVVVNSFHSRELGERTVAEINDSGGTALHAWGSIINEEHVDSIFATIRERFGALDALVCNASDGRIGPFLSLSSDDWDRAFRTNVSGHHACVRRAAPLMAARGGGAIVTMSTVGAHGYVRGLGSQGVVKAAVESMTRYLACELAAQNIRVNCVAAGPVYGSLLDKLAETTTTREHWEAMTPGGALCDPLDIARVIAFLVSDHAIGTNGSIISVDRGFSSHVDGRLVSPGLDALTGHVRAAS